MKVALIDNMNNNFFSLARYLRDFGIEAHLYITSNNPEHFLPQADTFEDVNRFNWIHTFPVDIKPISWALLDKNKLKAEFSSYDLVISCGLSSAFLERAGVRSDIIIPYGSDLYEVPFWRIEVSLNLKEFLRSIGRKLFSYYQKKAYQKARVVITNFFHPLYKEAVEKLGINAINGFIPMVYNLEKFPPLEKTIFSFLRKYDFIVFNHSRQIWCSNPDNLKDFSLYKGNKRNDKIIKAFVKFLKITKFKKPILVLFEYGPDVTCSKKLIKELGIKNNVKWMEKTYRKEILVGLKYASLGTDQLRENLCGFGGTSTEVMASGIPLLTYTNGAIYNPKSFLYKAPIIEVLTEDDILKVFIDYEKNPEKYKKIGRKSKEWFDKHLGIGLAKKYAILIEILVKNKNLTQNDKNVREIFED